MKKIIIGISAMVLVLLLVIGVSYCGKNAAESTPTPTTAPTTSTTEPGEKPSDSTAGTQPSASVPTEPEKQDPIPSEPAPPPSRKLPLSRKPLLQSHRSLRRRKPPNPINLQSLNLWNTFRVTVTNG